VSVPALGRTALVLLLLLTVHARGEASQGGFDQALAADVFTAAFGFMAPRTLERVTVPQMTQWGLRGISAIDPDLVPLLGHGAVTLLGQGQPLAVFAAPATDDPAGWGALIAKVNARAWTDSAALRRVGTQGVITSFFEEVFNHLDPYSRYVPPEAARAERDFRRGAAGVGISLGGRAGDVVITEVVAEGPGDGAGLHQGERVIGIDGVAAGRVDAQTLQARLDGEAGSVVRLSVRDRHGRLHDIAITRAPVPADTVSARIDHDVLVLQVSAFTGSTAARLRHELDQGMGRKPQPHGVVIDLRGNRGGVLDQAVAAADLLLENGLIATTVGRDPRADHRWAASAGDLAQGLPVIVLVDGRSASASEVLAAALSDDGRAVVVGSTTLGKGLVQTVGAMPDGGELFITWSRVLAPDGWPLQGLGVMPQVCTALGEAATQRQLDALNSGQEMMARTLALHRAARPNLPLAEMLAIRDNCPADLGHETDMVAARFLIDNPIAYASALAPQRAVGAAPMQGTGPT
jgi:carboxyl-terminal processing protease